jgi:hypothetical protein
MAIARAESGTPCSLPPFMRSAGMTHIVDLPPLGKQHLAGSRGGQNYELKRARAAALASTETASGFLNQIGSRTRMTSAGLIAEIGRSPRTGKAYVLSVFRHSFACLVGLRQPGS